jgi:hypothetical protein
MMPSLVRSFMCSCAGHQPDWFRSPPVAPFTNKLPSLGRARTPVLAFAFQRDHSRMIGTIPYLEISEPRLAGHPSPRTTRRAHCLNHTRDDGGDPGILMAGSALAMMPLLVLFFFAQRYFMEGIATTRLK